MDKLYMDKLFMDKLYGVSNCSQEEADMRAKTQSLLVKIIRFDGEYYRGTDKMGYRYISAVL